MPFTAGRDGAWESDEHTPVFVISVAAELSGLHAQTLRQYDRLGLVSPGMLEWIDRPGWAAFFLVGWVPTLVFEVVQQGVGLSGADPTELHQKIVNRVERELISQVMQSCNNVQTKAAHRLGINRNTLRSKLVEYNLETKEENQ